jgi:2',3'-cyclic-nucleotide 2'-phosphodiesterase (5'-nucleotidase family)
VAVRCLGLVTAILLSACAEIQTSEPAPGPVTQFRLAAEQSVSWHADGIPAGAPGKDLVHAKILGFNDFHGNLNQLSIEGRPVGGAAVLAAYLQSESAEIDGNAIIVHGTLRRRRTHKPAL